MWIEVKSKKVSMDEKVLALGVEPKEEDFYWSTTYIRSEDVCEFYALTDSKIVICFYEEKPKILIKDKIEEFVRRMISVDYNAETSLNELD